jgi:hypothetical protein
MEIETDGVGTVTLVKEVMGSTYLHTQCEFILIQRVHLKFAYLNTHPTVCPSLAVLKPSKHLVELFICLS